MQHGSQIPPQSVSPQPPYYAGIIMPSQTLPPAQGYTQFPARMQYPYGQIPKNVINPMPYNPQIGMYPGQQFRPPVIANQQSFPPDLAQYQTQPIIQPISQNVIGSAERPSSGRGPKPMVPPRGNSKITHDPGHRKSASSDTAAVKLENMMMKCEITNQPNATETQDETTLTTSAISNPAVAPERVFATPLNQTPRTRQDGLYVDTSTNQTTKNKTIDPTTSDCGIYVSCSEHRKSASVDVTTGFQRSEGAHV